MATSDNLEGQIETIRSAMQREWDNPKVAAAMAFDGVTVPLLAIAHELRRIRELMERQADA